MSWTSKSNLFWLIGAAVVLVALGLGVVVQQPRITSDITEFLPVEDSAELRTIRELTRSTLSRRAVVLVEGEDVKSNRDVVRDIAADLERTELFREISYAPEGIGEVVHETYFPMRLNFLAETRQELEVLDTEAGMEAAAADFRREITGRFGPIVQRLGPEDPLLAYVSILKRLESLAESTMSITEGQYVTDSGGAVLMLRLKQSPFDSQYAAHVDRAINGAIAGQSLDPERVHVSGFHRYTHVIASSTKRDMTRIGIASIALIVVLFGLIWGRVRWLFLPIVSIVVGGAVAAAATAITFGSLHLLTIAFGASLIGVCADYSVHLLNDYASSGRGDGKIWRSVTLSAVTTSIGFGALIGSSVPALRQLAFFSVVGILTAVAVAYLIARLTFSSEPPSLKSSYRGVLDFSGRLLQGSRSRRWIGLGLALLVVVAAALGFTRLEWESSLDTLMNPAPQLREEDAYVRSQVSGLSSDKVILVSADTAEDALQTNDELAIALSELVEDGALSNYVSLHAAVWSRKRQEMNQTFVRNHEDALISRMREAFAEAGVRPDRLQPVRDGFDVPESVLTIEELRDGPISSSLALFDVANNGSRLITYLGDVSNMERIESVVDGIDKAVIVRQKQALDHAYVEFRRSVTWLTAVGLGLILAVLSLAYRDPKSVLVVMTPPLLAAVASLGVLSLLGARIGLAHVLSLLMVIGIGVDYGVMLRGHRDEGAKLVLSLTMAYLTTLAAFGTLMLSDHPVLEAIGATIAVGTTCCLLVLPGLDGLLVAEDGSDG